METGKSQQHQSAVTPNNGVATFGVLTQEKNEWNIDGILMTKSYEAIQYKLQQPMRWMTQVWKSKGVMEVEDAIDGWGSVCV